MYIVNDLASFDLHSPFRGMSEGTSNALAIDLSSGEYQRCLIWVGTLSVGIFRVIGTRGLKIYRGECFDAS